MWGKCISFACRGEMKRNRGGRESIEEIRGGMPEIGGWPVVYGVGNEAGFIGGDVAAEELESGG